MRKHNRIIALLAAVIIFAGLAAGCTYNAVKIQSAEVPEGAEVPAEEGIYTGAEELALYIHTYGHLPDNFITKHEARALGWDGGSLEECAPGKCIGGDRFGNREGLLPDAPGREWTECDVNTLGADCRGAERLVFSNDGLIYYTGDHYDSFTLIYRNKK